MKNSSILLLVIAFTTLAVSSTAKAALITYSDRPTWEAALSGAIIKHENFSSAPGNISFGGSSITFGDLKFASNKTPAGNAKINASGNYLDLDAFSGHYAEVTLPTTLSNFGFDYTQHDATGDPLRVTIGGSLVASLPNQLGNGGAFFGVIDDSGETIDDFRFVGSGGMYAKIDRISWAVPEPSSLVLFGLGTVGLVLVGRRQRKGKLAA